MKTVPQDVTASVGLDMQSWSDTYCTLAQVLPHIFTCVTQTGLQTHPFISTARPSCVTHNKSASGDFFAQLFESLSPIYSTKSATLSTRLDLKGCILPAQDDHI